MVRRSSALIMLAASVATALGCRSTSPTQNSIGALDSSAASVAAPSASAAAAVGRQRFGEPISASAAAVPITALLSEPEHFQGRPVVVEGHVRRACARKGCWMELAERSEPTLPGCRVTFKDYGFFVPTDSAGATARVQAALEMTTLKPAMVTHLEREGAVFAQKSEDGSAREVRLIATGVELWR